MLVVAALSLTALLAMTALVLNFGFFQVQRRQLQNAADAAAMAVSWKIFEQQAQRCFDDAPITAAATDLAQRNGVNLTTNSVQVTYVNSSGTPISGPINAQVAGGKVSISGQFSTLLPGFAGQSGIPMTVESQAQWKRHFFLSIFDDPTPLAAPLSAFNAAQSYNFYSSSDLITTLLGRPPALDLRHPQNSGSNYVPATHYDFGNNFRYWSSGGSYDSGRFGLGNTIYISTVTSIDTKQQLRSGLLERVARQNLLCNGQRYVVFPVFLYSSAITATTTTVTVAGFTWFRMLEADIGIVSLPGHFIPSVYDLGNRSVGGGVGWGPGMVMLTQ